MIFFTRCPGKITSLAATLTLAGSLSAANLFVGNGGDLQGTLNAARGGDTVTIQAGAQFTGHFFLPANPSSQTITIQSSAISALPGSGQRVSSSDRGNMPKLASADGVAALTLSTGANHYRIQGIEVLALPGVYAQDLIRFGNGDENSNDKLPYDLDLDRCYVHGDPVSGSKRGLSLNSGSATVENSYFENFFSTWQDTQAISGWNGPGPYKIINNFLSAGTETVAFGGAIPANYGVIPSDILVQNNYFFKPMSWRVGDPSYAGIPVWVKNHLELKVAQRVTIDSNTMENNWVGADQRGFAIMFTVRSELGALPYTTINNIKVTNNVIRHSPAGMCFSGRDDNGMGWGGADTIENNLFDDVNSRWGGDGRLFQITGGLQGANFNHNTAFQNGFIAAFDDGSSSNINFTNNIFNVGQNLVGNGTGAGNPTIAAYMGGGSFKNNLVIGANPSSYPSTNFFPGSIGQVGFVNYAGQNYALVPSSPYKNVGTDGKDPGMPTATSSTTGTSSIPTGWVEIVAKHSQKCFDIVAWQGSEYQAGTPLEQWTCWGGWMQQFKLTPVAGGYEITTRASGYQLDVAWALTNDGASIIQYPFWGGSNEVFTFVDLGNGYYNIRPNNSGKCLDVMGVSNDDGAKVIQWTCWGGDNQQFKLVPTGN